MRESSTYQLIVEEGAIESRRETILVIGTKRFGEPAAEIRAALSRTEEMARLVTLRDRLLDVSSWAELMKPQRTRKRET